VLPSTQEVEKTARLPALSIPHGGDPCFFMDWPPQLAHAWDSLAAFLRGLRGTLDTRPPTVRNERLRTWLRAPAARLAHPREEHLLPLMVAAGAAGADVGTKVFRDRILGASISGYRFG